MGEVAGGGAWGEYAQLARALDEVRRAEESETARLGSTVEDMRAEADRLEGYLGDQGVRLTDLGKRLRKKAAAEPIPYEQAPDAPPLRPGDALRDIADRINLADREAEKAAERALLPAWLPRWPEFLRNLLIYGVAAAGTMITQWNVVQRHQAVVDERIVEGGSDGGFFVRAFVVVPLLWFLAGWAVASVANKPRTEGGRTPNSAPAQGFLLCFLVSPILLIVVVGYSFLNR